MTVVLSVMNLLINLLWSRVLIWTEHVHFFCPFSAWSSHCLLGYTVCKYIGTHLGNNDFLVVLLGI
jgi:hypothetical protein